MAIRCLRGFFSLVPVLTLACVTTAFPQRKLNFSTVEFGIGPSLVSIHDNDPDIAIYPKASIAGSAGLVYALKKRLGVTAQVMYERKGGRTVHRPSAVEVPESKYNTTSSYLSFSPGMRRYLANTGVFVEGGPFIAFLFASETVKHVGAAKSEIKNPYASFDAGLSASVGYTPSRNRFQGWNFRLVNNLGVADINHHTGTKEWSNALSLIAGVRFRMR